MTRLLFPAILVLAACSTPEQERIVDVTIGGGGGKTIYLDRFKNNKPEHIDSLVLDANGHGTFHPGKLPLDFYAVSFSEQDMAVIVLDSAESVTLEATAGKLAEPSKVEGSKQSDLLYGFFKEAKKYEEEKQQLVTRVNSDRADTDAIDRINKLNSDFYTRCKMFTQEHKNSPVVLASVSRLNIQNDLPLFQEVRDALARTIPHSEYYHRIPRPGGTHGTTSSRDESAGGADGQVGQPDPRGGRSARLLAGRAPTARSISLSSLRGKVVLIDFWASWCKPCRMENPNVKRVYEQYRGKGFEILGVSLDRDRGAWTGAIAQDGLPWKHVSDLQFWNNAAAQQYGVSSIPYTVLVDKDGKSPRQEPARAGVGREAC